MQREPRRWYSGRTGRDMGLVVYGHWGRAVLAFPTSGGDEWEFEQQGVIHTLAPLIDGGRVKLFCVGSNSSDSFYRRDAHPRHRSWMQKQYDEYIRWEVLPFIADHGRGQQAVTTAGMSLGAYHAANTLFKHPDTVRGCYAMSGIYDLRRFMDGDYDDNFYFNNPVDYLASLSDPHLIRLISTSDLHLVTGHGPWERPEHTYRLSHVLASRGIHHQLDDWGPQGGHDWPYWRPMLWEYFSRF